MHFITVEIQGDAKKIKSSGSQSLGVPQIWMS